MTRSILSLLLASALAFPFGSKAQDPRIQRLTFDESSVFTVNSAQGVATQIVFAHGEEINSVASGFTDGWQFVAKGNSLHLKPRTLEQTEGFIAPVPGKWDTNLNVSTNRRNYTFALRLVNQGVNAPHVAYRIEFLYPQDEALARIALEESQRREAAVNAQPEMPAPRNMDYQVSARRKSKDIVPTVIFDDGRFTYFKFPANREIPSIYILSASGEESMVNYHMEHDFVIVQRVARRFVLRLGNQRVSVSNRGFELDGVPAEGSTTIEGVERTTKGVQQ